MTDVFDLKQTAWNFRAVPSAALAATKLPLPKKRASARRRRSAFAHDATYWAAATRGYDWSAEDRIDAAAYNRVLWQGIRGAEAYPLSR